MVTHFRIARPVGDLERAVAMYVRGLGLRLLDRFADHAGFDGAMLGHPGQPFHFEFTRRRSEPVVPSPTSEDLVVIYLPDRFEWSDACARLLEAGFVPSTPSNPYWEGRGRTFTDPDGYLVVVQNDHWAAAEPSPIQADSPHPDRMD
jgi:catechol 2,3-dioxygenase-like lactoylglutathione lyase family enzyme